MDNCNLFIYRTDSNDFWYIFYSQRVVIMPKQKTIIIDSWTDAKKLKLFRSSPCHLYNEILDNGVNYFILTLEKLGCKTLYSCEGHFHKKHYAPQFYISFYASTRIIKQLKKHLFDIAYIEKEYNRYCNNEYSIRIDFKNYKDKTQKLTQLANNWNKIFGSITYENI